MGKVYGRQHVSVQQEKSVMCTTHKFSTHHSNPNATDEELVEDLLDFVFVRELVPVLCHGRLDLLQPLRDVDQRRGVLIIDGLKQLRKYFLALRRGGRGGRAQSSEGVLVAGAHHLDARYEDKRVIVLLMVPIDYRQFAQRSTYDSSARTAWIVNAPLYGRCERAILDARSMPLETRLVPMLLTLFADQAQSFSRGHLFQFPLAILMKLVSASYFHTGLALFPD